jgi:hypothetical protein
VKSVAFILSAPALLFGLAAVCFWYAASRVEAQDPVTDRRIWRPSGPEDFIFPTIEARRRSDRLNKIAAVLTGVAVLLGALASFAALQAPP